MSLCVKYNGIIYFASFVAEHIPKDIIKFIGSTSLNKNIIRNVFRIQGYDSIMCGYFCIEFNNFMLSAKKLTDCTNLFSPNDFKKNGNIILSYFKDE